MNKKPQRLSLSVVIPVYNEVGTVSQLVGRVLKSPLPTEIVIVDDGSTDGTVEILKKLKESSKKVSLYLQKINKGKGASVRLGITKAKGKYILIQDADLEYSVSDYSKLVAPILSGRAQIVYGTRFTLIKNNVTFLSRASNWFLTSLTKLFFGSRITDMECCFKLFPRDLALKLGLKANRFDFEPEITAKFLKKGYSIEEVPVSYKPRGWKEGKKINVVDGFEAIVTLFRYRFFEK